MSKETRINQIKRIVELEKPVGRIDIPWKDALEPMDVIKFH